MEERIAIALAVLGFVVVAWMLFFGLVLKSVVAVFNAIAGRQWVPTPSLFKAMGVGFIVLLVDVGFLFAIGLTGYSAQSVVRNPGPLVALLFLASIPVGFLVKSAIIGWTLPTNFGRALAVFATQKFVLFAISAVAMITMVAALAVANAK